jgi:hypothetical protein
MLGTRKRVTFELRVPGAKEKLLLVKNIRRRMLYWHARKTDLEHQEKVSGQKILTGLSHDFYLGFKW